MNNQQQLHQPSQIDNSQQALKPQIPLPQQQQPSQEKIDCVSRIGILVQRMNDALNELLRSAAEVLNLNNQIDTSSKVSDDASTLRFDRLLEEFFLYCDQLEYNVVTAKECFQQGLSSQKHLPLAVATARTDGSNAEMNALSYPQFLNTIRAQVTFVDELKEVLLKYAHDVKLPLQNNMM